MCCPNGMSSTKSKLTEQQLFLIKQALGIDSPNPFCRNFYAVSLVDQPDIDLVWRELIGMGLAYVAKEPCHRLKVRIYAVTEEGKRLVSDLTGVVPFVQR